MIKTHQTVARLSGQRTYHECIPGVNHAAALLVGIITGRCRLADVCNLCLPQLWGHKGVLDETDLAAHAAAEEAAAGAHKVVIDKDAETAEAAVAEEDAEQDKGNDDDEEGNGCNGESEKGHG